MQAYGSDRLRVREDGAAVLACHVPKAGWNARATKTSTTAEHPGTAVLWDEACWEVVGIEVVERGIRYTLRPWPEAAAMRLTVRYDVESEAERAAETRRQIAREKGRVAANLLAFVTGHLPSAVQEQLGSEVGINPVRMTQLSALPPFVVCVATAVFLAGRLIEQKASGIPALLIAFIVYMFVDSLFRFLFTLSVHRPIGSLPGLGVYALFYALSPKQTLLIAPFAAPKGTSIKTTPLSAEERLESSLTVWEPLFTLLSVEDQKHVAERYGIDYRKTASTIAAILLVASALGIISSLSNLSASHPTAALSFLVAAGIFGEQIWRLTAFKSGPAPSVLRFALRWMVRPYLKS